MTSPTVSQVRLASSRPEVGPQRLNRVEVGRIGRQPLHHQPVPLDGQEGAHRAATVGAQSGIDPAFGEQLFNLTVGQAERRYQRTASTITSGGKRRRRRQIEGLAWGEGGGFSCRQSRCSDAVAPNAQSRGGASARLGSAQRNSAPHASARGGSGIAPKFICMALYRCIYDRCPMDAAQGLWERAPAHASTGNFLG
jgi:hypothetical protein